MPRKMDRRTLYTRKTVKDALLELLEEQSYEKVTVAALCRQAEITRATFYLHFESIDEVLNELLDEALMVAKTIVDRKDAASRMDALAKLLYTGNADCLRKDEHLLSPCQRIAYDPKYLAIFQDSTLSSYVIQRVYRMERDEIIPYFMERCNLPYEYADKLFMLIVYGQFYMNQSLKWNKDENWYEMQFVASCFVLGGLEALRKRNQNSTER